MDYRTQRKVYRRQMRDSSGGLGVLIWLIVIASLAMTHLWQLSILVFCGLPFFFFVLRPILFSRANTMKQQEQPIYQQPSQPSQQEQTDNQPSPQGYGAQQPAAQQRKISQKGGQLYQYPAQQAPQYDEPITMYPQE